MVKMDQEHLGDQELGTQQCPTLQHSLEVLITMILTRLAPVLIIILELLEHQVTVLKEVDPIPQPHPALLITPKTILPINPPPLPTRAPLHPKVMYPLHPLQEAAPISHPHLLVMLLLLLA